MQKQKKKLTKNDYENEKVKFIEGADCQLILYAMKDKESNIIVTEESKSQNDNKLFKKIPLICDQEGDQMH